MESKEGRPSRRLAAPLLLAAWGAAISLRYGRVAFHPLDHSIVFDGAWRLMCGQIPFRDFDTPCGIVPMILQVPFFSVMGVTWLAYCTHAALVNAVFAASAYGLLRLMGAQPLPASAYAALAALTLYPPTGAPFMDQHAYFFCFAAAALAAAAGRSRSPWAAALGAASSLALVAAYLSKQNPTVFAAPIVVATLVMAEPHARRRAWTGAAAGALASVLGIALMAWLAGVDLARFQFDFHTTPLAEAARRAASDQRPVGVALVALLRRLGMATLALGPVLAVFAGVEAWRARLLGEHRVALLLAGFMPLVGIAGAYLANNDPEETLAMLFPSLGLLDTVLAATGFRLERVAASATRVLLLAAALRDGAAFHFHVNVPRRAIAEAFAADDAAGLPAPLRFLVWRIPAPYRIDAGDFSRTVAFLEEHPGNFWLLGDATILYGVTGRPSIGTSLWFHPGLSMPVPGSAAFAELERSLIQELKSKRVRYVILEGRGTWFEVRLKNFRVLRWLLSHADAQPIQMGQYTILQVPESLRQPAPRMASIAPTPR